MKFNPENKRKSFFAWDVCDSKSFSVSPAFAFFPILIIIAVVSLLGTGAYLYKVKVESGEEQGEIENFQFPNSNSQSISNDSISNSNSNSNLGSDNSSPSVSESLPPTGDSSLSQSFEEESSFDRDFAYLTSSDFKDLDKISYLSDTISNDELEDSKITLFGDSNLSSNLHLGENLHVLGGEGLNSDLVNNTITVSGEDASTDNKGIAKYTDAQFTVTDGNVEIDDIYVRNSGDTMTGKLYLPEDGLQVGDSQIVTSNGKVGVGTTYPVGTFHVKGNYGTGGDSVYDLEENGKLYRVHKFTSTGENTFTPPDGGLEVEYLVVGGGGGTLGNWAGGGGGGGVLAGSTTLSQKTSVTVGAGGSGSVGYTGGASGVFHIGIDNLDTTENGLDSSLGGVIAKGGGHGGERTYACNSNNVCGYLDQTLLEERRNYGAPGGSGGGGGFSCSSKNPPEVCYGFAGGAGTPGQGYSGGTPSYSGWCGGGGGGAGAPGSNCLSNTGGAGGDGISSSITGTLSWYGGGGGGSSWGGSVYAKGGRGGGGDGGIYYSLPDWWINDNSHLHSHGMPNTGGGGGGRFYSANISGSSNGGSGIVVVRYLIEKATQSSPIVTFEGGNVGIGTTATKNTLSVKGDSDFMGKVGIGTTSPTTTLQVAGNVLFQNLADTTSAFQVNNSSGTTLFNVDTTNGRVGIGTSIPNGAPADKLSINGSASIFDTTSLGPERVANNNFATSSSWSFGTNWSHDSSNNEADHASGSSTSSLSTTLSPGLIIGEVYQVTFTVKNRTAGNVTPLLGYYSTGATVYSNATFSQQIRAGDNYNSNLSFIPSSDFDGSIDDVSVKLVRGGDLKLYGLLTGGGTSGLRVSASGSVGIGTNFETGAPIDKLTVVDGNQTLYNTATLGSEKVSNGAFSTVPDTNWTWGTNWSHDTANTEADHTTGNTSALEQNVSAIAGEIYQVVFTVKNRTAGSVTPQIGGVGGTLILANTTSTQQIRATGTGNLKFVPTSDFDGTIDTVSVKLILGGDLKISGVITGGGTSGLKVLANGNIGIGTTAPLSKLDVNGGMALGTYAGTSVAPSNSLIISGSIGIGTTLPTNNLSFGNGSDRKLWIENSATDVVGRALTVSSGSTIAGTAVSNVNGGNLILQSGLGTGTGSSNIYFQTGTTGTTGMTLQTMSTKMTILGNGNVGIGVTNPPSKLFMGIPASASYTNGMLMGYTDGRVSEGLSLWYDGNSYTTSYIDSRYDNSAAAMSFRMRASGTPITAMTILGSGNIGIGLTSPRKSLDVLNSSSSQLRLTYTDNSVYTDFQTTSAGNLYVNPSGGKVSIGSTNPPTRLFVGSPISPSYTDGLLVGYTDGRTNEGIGIWYDSGGYTTGYVDSRYDSASAVMNFRMRTSGTPVTSMTISGSGNVGIGTTAPASKLNVVGGNISVQGAGYGFYTDNGTNSLIKHVSGGEIRIGESGVWNKIIVPSGNVGIGTTNPLTKLHVVDSNRLVGTANLRITTSDSLATDVGGALGLGGVYNSAGDNTNFAALKSGKDNSTDGNIQGYLSFYTQPATGLAERMRITSGGNVGIGTTNPISLLHVTGTTLFQNSANAVNSYQFNNLSGTSVMSVDTTNGRVGIGTTAPENPLNVVGTVSSMSDTGASRRYLRFGVTSTTARISTTYQGSGPDPDIIVSNYDTGDMLTIKSTGKIGIGTTAPLNALSIVNSTPKIDIAKSYTSVSTAPTTISSGSYIQLGGLEWGTNSYRLISFGHKSTSGVAPAYIGYQEIANLSSTKGDLVFGTRDVETSTTEPTERMRINSAGNVGIGTTNPSYKLDVSGQINSSNKITASESTGTSNGGFTFNQDGNQDTGMFSPSDGIIDFYNNNIQTVRINSGGGIVVGSPTGGDKGTGTINATAVYDDNVLLTDYVFDKYFDGVVQVSDVPLHADYSMLSLDQMADYISVNRHLPTIPGRDEWERNGKFSLGVLANHLWETAETQALYVVELNSQVSDLNGKWIMGNGESEIGLLKSRVEELENFQFSIFNSQSISNSPAIGGSPVATNSNDSNSNENANQNDNTSESSDMSDSSYTSNSNLNSNDNVETQIETKLALLGISDLGESLTGFLRKVWFSAKVTFEKTVAFMSEVTFGGKVKFEKGIELGKDSAGQVVVLKGEKQVEVLFEEGYEKEPIVSLTLIQKDESSNWFRGSYRVITKTENGFFVELSEKQDEDTVFDWQAFEPKENTKIEETTEENPENQNQNENQNGNENQNENQNENDNLSLENPFSE